MLFLCLGVVDEENFHNIYTHLFPWGEEAIYQYKNIIHHLFLLDRQFLVIYIDYNVSHRFRLLIKSLINF